MQRSRLAFAIATAIVVTAVPVFAGQRATGAASASGRAPVRAALSPVQKELQGNLVLANGVRGRLHGTDPVAAASGFRRLELFVATVHASNTLAIPFFELKRRIVRDRHDARPGHPGYPSDIPLLARSTPGRGRRRGDHQTE